MSAIGALPLRTWPAAARAFFFRAYWPWRNVLSSKVSETVTSRNQIISEALIGGSVRKCRAERAELPPALRAPVVPWSVYCCSGMTGAFGRHSITRRHE